MRKEIEERLAPTVVRRVRFFLINFARFGQDRYQAYIAVDDTIVWDFSDGKQFKEIEDRIFFTTTLRESLKMNVEDCLESEVPLLNALAFLDARLGKRRLKKLANRDFPHEKVAAFLKLRLEAEGLID